MSLQEAFDAHGSDKATNIFAHGFHRYYKRFIPDLAKPVTLLEIGVEKGSSMRAWET